MESTKQKNCVSVCDKCLCICMCVCLCVYACACCVYVCCACAHTCIHACVCGICVTHMLHMSVLVGGWLHTSIKHAHTYTYTYAHTYGVSKELWFLKARFMGTWLDAADVIKRKEYVMLCSQLCRQFYLNLIVVLWVPVHYTSHWWIT